jgi:subtilase family serine protease
MTLLNRAVRNCPVRLFAGAFTRRYAASVTIGAFASLLFAPCGAFALSGSTLALAPEIAKSNLVSAMDPAKEIIIQLTLPLSDRQGAYDLLKHVSTPKDALYHHYITAQEFAARFGANAADYAKLRAWAVANGLSIVHESSARISLSVRGTVAQVQKLFKTQLNYYKTASGQQFYSASVEPTVPSEIASTVQKVVGLTGGAQNAALYKIAKILGESPVTSAVRTDTAGGTGPGGTYGASDLRTAYQIPAFGGVSRQVVAVFEDTGIHASDFQKYLTTNKLPAIKLKQIPVNQSTAAINGDQIEAVLDVDMIAAINPQVSEIQLYAAPGSGDSISQFSTDLVDVFDAVGMAASEPGGPSILSVSYGLDEIQMALGGGDPDTEGAELEALAMEGVTVFVSAGDQGAYGRTGLDNNPPTLNAPDPGSQIFVTSVGGTTLFTYSEEQRLGETVWNDLGLYTGAGATGGGVSNLWPNPTIGFYQGTDLVEYNGGDGSARNVPDVAALADPLTGVGIYLKSQGGWMQIGGTSASAPMWAGYMSIVNAAGQFLGVGNVGFLNPLLYFTGTNFYASNDASPAGLGLWHSIVDGTNGNFNLYGVPGYSAGYFYNNCCGLGSLFGPYAYQLLSAAFTNSSSLVPTNLKARPGVTTAKITWTRVSGASGYGIYVDELTPVGNPPTNFDLTSNAQALVTKDATVTLSGLTSGKYYGVFVTTVANVSGVSETGTATIEFQAK